jgi:hypothetical protein
MSRGAQSGRVSACEALWIEPRCRAEPPPSRTCARGEGSLRRCRARVPSSSATSPDASLPRCRAGAAACSAMSPIPRAARTPRVAMERSPGERFPGPRHGCAGGRRVAVPAPSGERGATQCGQPPRREPSPPTAFPPGTPGPRWRTRATGARRSASRRPRCRRRPTTPRRSGRPRGTGWCSRRRGDRRRGCGSYPAKRGRPRRSGSPRG